MLPITILILYLLTQACLHCEDSLSSTLRICTSSHYTLQNSILKTSKSKKVSCRVGKVSSNSYIQNTLKIFQIIKKMTINLKSGKSHGQAHHKRTDIQMMRCSGSFISRETQYIYMHWLLG